ncbi:TPA: DAK2 domain-containing protein [Bacillus thuringiensis]|nr:DAK2 domain-containing protein [Bacillus thuringiensis]HDX9492639.1 DAK2 domain-containing protein [Bacillus thuringiensis]HDX9617379.1 DAK2 domain-containing protein [Bacillus thuringiensis]HDX9690908.1 DAK2 domain-containing protein [Bacillus thuringiensis]
MPVNAAGEKRELTVKEFAEMLQAALQGIQSIGERSFGRGAVVGEKTLVDALGVIFTEIASSLK